MVILVDDDEESSAPVDMEKPELTPSKTSHNDIPAPMPWESPKVDRAQHREDRSPSTANSSQTAFSDPSKPIPEKVRSPLKGTPETVPLPFASTKLRSSKDAGVSTTDLRPDVQAAAKIQAVVEAQTAYDDWVQAMAPRQSPDSPSNWSKPSHKHTRVGQPPESQSFAIRPGPRIAGKAYSVDSSSENGISADDDRNSSRSRGGPPDRPTSQESNASAIRSNVQPSDIRWRKVEDQQTGLGRGGKAPIKMPGRASQESAESRRGPWKTKKSLSPYGFLFDDH